MAETHKNQCRRPLAKSEEAVQLIKDYTTKQTRPEVEFYLGLVEGGKQSF